MTTKENKPQRRKHYFSLMEIMIAVVIVGLMAGIAGTKILSYLDRAKRDQAKAQIKILKDNVKGYYFDVQEFPANLQALITNPGNEKWDGPYLDASKIPLDPWGQEYHYDCPGQENRDFDIYSYGKDKSPGGTGKNADINSWD